jgi:aminoglycoside phosphotransferase (APT) family kinase protein
MVRAMQTLAGGTHARTYLIQVDNPERDFVLRVFPPGDAAASEEARVLGLLDGLDGLAPQLLASEPGRANFQEPWNLMTRLPGAADITHGQPAAWARELGSTLARIHATARRRLSGLIRVFDRPGGSLTAMNGLAANVVASHWDTLLSAPEVLTHYDFWSGNVLWDSSGLLSGVVDWSGGAIGPRGFDIGWCRLDLYLLHGKPTADAFLDAYQTASGSEPLDPLLWDLWACARSFQNVETWAPNYRDLGRADLTAAELSQRHAAWTHHLIRRSPSAAF